MNQAQSQFLIAQKISRRVVADALKAGYLISVFDGEAWPCKRSNKVREILSHMFTTDSDKLVLRRKDGSQVGFVWLIYENGADVISDCSSETPEIDQVLAQAETMADRLAA